MTTPDLADSSRWVTTGTDFMLNQIDVVDLATPSLLSGWLNAHVVAHLARNADALCRLLTWAETGIETPMYASPADRTTEIERDATRPDHIQRADVRASAERFVQAMDTLDPEAWQAPVRSARGRQILALEVPWLRVREVWLHALDLGAPIDAMPPDLVEALVSDVTLSFDIREDRPNVTLRAPSRSWTIGDGQFTVTGPAPALLSWLVGRSLGRELVHEEPLPSIPNWL
jgi:maleylpyruvate isomerase